MATTPTDPDLLRSFREAVLAHFRRDLAQEAQDAERLRASVVPGVTAAIAAARAQGLCGRAWLFGSFAWGKPREGSDVDVMVDAGSDPDRVGALVAAASGREVHIVPAESAPPPLRQRVLAEGHPL